MEKYRISGPDALAFLNRLVTRDISGLKANRVTYVVWCNDEGRSWVTALFSVWEMGNIVSVLSITNWTGCCFQV